MHAGSADGILQRFNRVHASTVAPLAYHVTVIYGSEYVHLASLHGLRSPMFPYLVVANVVASQHGCQGIHSAH
jgi:hypothetical protein